VFNIQINNLIGSDDITLKSKYIKVYISNNLGTSVAEFQFFALVKHENDWQYKPLTSKKIISRNFANRSELSA